MAVKHQRGFEADLDMTVWSYGGKCPTCSGILKYQYLHKTKPEVILKVMPNRKRFEVHQQVDVGHKKRYMIILHGSLADMKTLLAAL